MATDDSSPGTPHHHGCLTMNHEIHLGLLPSIHLNSDFCFASVSVSPTPRRGILLGYSSNWRRRGDSEELGYVGFGNLGLLVVLLHIIRDLCQKL